MSTTNTPPTYLDPKDPTVAPILQALGLGNTKRSVRLETRESVELHGLYWDGGSRSTYKAVELQSNRILAIPQANPPQFGGPSTTPKALLQPSYVIVETSIFCGKTMPPTIYAHPDAITRLLPPQTINGGNDLTKDEQIVLAASAQLKSHARRDEAARHGITAARYDQALQNLKERQLLNTNASITTSGRNLVATNGWRAY